MTYNFAPRDYGSACAALVNRSEPCDLGPGQPNHAVRAQLEALDQSALFGNRLVRDDDMADCCRAGLWLLHDFLDESHTISQSIPSSSGSYWHGIMHRREPDYSNAKYWFRRVGQHAIYSTLCAAAQEIARRYTTDRESSYLMDQAAWDPYRFIDLCEAASRGKANVPLCREIAQVEWRILFDACYRSAL